MSRTHPATRRWLTLALWVAGGAGFIGLIWFTATGNPYATLIIGAFWVLIGIGYAIRLIRNRGRIRRSDPVITAAENLQTPHTGTTPGHTTGTEQTP